MKILFFITAFGFIAIACTNSKKTTETKLQNQITQKPIVLDSIYRFTVSFISIGGGTDKNAKQTFRQFIDQYNENNAVKINVETSVWGKEGETDYCLKLIELNKEKQDRFISDVKNLLKESTLVRFSENSVCKYKK
jgi:hypothetical protein